MTSSSLKFLSDLPDPAKEISKCNDFLSNFRDEYGELKYMNILVSIDQYLSNLLSIINATFL